MYDRSPSTRRASNSRRKPSSSCSEPSTGSPRSPTRSSNACRRTRTPSAGKSGETVFEEGDLGICCYVIHSGDVKIVRRFPDGRRITLARMGPGSVFGELALFNGERRSASVVALEPTSAVVLAAEDVMGVLRTDAEASLAVADRPRGPPARDERAALRVRAGDRLGPRRRDAARPGRGAPGAGRRATRTSRWSAARRTSRGWPDPRARASCASCTGSRTRASSA